MLLAALGLVPGSRVRLQQRPLAIVVWVEGTQLSLEGATTREIL